nr:MAG TPA_asm: hypothetical protein [Bacteriophage sp.]
MLSLGKRSCSSTASTATELSRVEIRSKGKATQSLGLESNGDA